MESDMCAWVLSMSVKKFFRMVLYIIQVRQLVWTHSPDREKLFLNGQLRYQWLEASVGSNVKKYIKHNVLEQGANQVWRLFDIDDIWYSEETERWVYDWSQGSSPL